MWCTFNAKFEHLKETSSQMKKFLKDAELFMNEFLQKEKLTTEKDAVTLRKAQFLDTTTHQEECKCLKQ